MFDLNAASVLATVYLGKITCCLLSRRYQQTHDSPTPVLRSEVHAHSKDPSAGA